MTQQDIIQLITGTLGSLGFSLLYNLRGRKLLIASLGGLLAWSVYLVFRKVVPDESIRYLIASAVITVYAEVFARVLKTPTTSFLVPAVIPLVPGGSLYYTMNHALNTQWQPFISRAFYTLQLALCIAVGIIAVTTLTRITMMILRKLRKQVHASYFHPNIKI